ncbi:helicase HerA-like domain-containing protein [Sandaracinobacteroides sp. A072]|uniref:helicase HerA-like domain-containing protein n=1 Tax=Sandaracinobacteroides sp. A072 TaxID=3461146 RepID=UPI00404125B9
MADIFIGAQFGGTNQQMLVLKRANRHGLIAGATGTGKTVTLQVLAEGFSNAGVPVFLSDVKGDLSGIAMPGSATSKLHDALQSRAVDIGLGNYPYADTPAVFWDLFGEQGHPVRTTISEMGPLLLARLLGLNETQEGVLAIAFKVADDQGMLLLDLKDLKQMLVWCADNAKALATAYGNVSRQSVGAIQRQLLALESQGGDRFFGEPALQISDMIRIAEDGRGQVNILAADKLMGSPKLYATFLLWMLSELFEEMPEVGDPEKPKMVFFFDEAHLLFDDAPKALLDKVEQVVRLIRSKGVGVYFVTQNPVDVPDSIAGQLGNRVQHALRAFTPRDQKAVRAAAQTFRPNPAVDVEREILELRTGEALVSLLMADGAPSPVERVLIRPPSTRLGPLEPGERKVIMATSPLAGKYEETLDRESAFEILSKTAARAAKAEAAEKAEAEARKAEAARAREEAAAQRARRNSPMGRIERVAMSTAQSAATQLGRSLVRGLLGGLFKGR